jgi:hypothetical protein
MTDITLTMSDLEFVTITFNAVLLLGTGLAMVFAKRLECLVSSLVQKNRPGMYRHVNASSFSAFSVRGHS